MAPPLTAGTTETMNNIGINVCGPRGNGSCHARIMDPIDEAAPARPTAMAKRG
jgi:hypothetical protein